MVFTFVFSDGLYIPVIYGFKIKLFYIEIGTVVNPLSIGHDEGLQLRDLYEDFMQEQVERQFYWTIS